jgi:hypothetical protein
MAAISGFDPVVIRMSEVMKDAEITVNVRVVNDWRWRLGMWLIRLGVRMVGASLKIEQPRTGEE